MRFFENGPAIPDELLHARDEGRVVFFCGAGVSQAKAGLPGFFGLAEKVMETLGVLVDSPARKLLEEARNLETKTGVVGVIPADRIFGLLEQDFPLNSALLHESYLGYHGRMLFFVQLIFSTRYDWGLPRWIIRLRMAQPKRLSTCWLAQLRAFSLSPMRCL